MVTVISRPQGHKIIDQAIEAEISNASGDALVTFPNHGLSTGGFVYITSDIDEYNGFWYVTEVNSNTFKISEGEATDFVEYYQDADIEYYQTQTHNWASIYLPIVYKLVNDKWPTNNVDAETLILASVNDNGFTEITTPGPIRASVNALEFVKISGASSPEANGIWQIVEVTLSNVYVINLPYELSGNLIGATVQYYYNNYQVKVKIFAGLNDSHPWAVKKPYEEVAELSITPDEDNVVMFSVADYIKMKVAVKNNLTLYSLPLNLDAFTGYYIATSESFDDSDGYSLFTAEQEFVDDSFEGYAIAGKLPFKNLYSGDYADYVYTSGSPARWLTNREILLAVEGYFFDVSFIKNIEGDFNLIIDKYVSDYRMLVETITFTNLGIGVYRIPITPDATYDSFCVRVESVAFTPEELDALNLWLENGSGYEWTDTSTPSTNLQGSIASENKYTEYLFIAGEIYTFYYEFQALPSGSPTLTSNNITIKITDSSDNVLASLVVPMPLSGESLPPLSSFLSRPEINRDSWVTGATPVFHHLATPTSTTSEILYTPYSFTVGKTYLLRLNFTSTAAGTVFLQVYDTLFFIKFGSLLAHGVGTFDLDLNFTATALAQVVGVISQQGVAGDATLNSLLIIDSAGVLVSGTYSFTAPENASRIGLSAEQEGTGTVAYQINDFTSETEDRAALNITEEICIDILETCESIDLFTQESRRLLEDGGYRLLE